MIKATSPAWLMVGWLLASAAVGDDLEWENPVFHDANRAVRTALAMLPELTPGEYSPLEMFTTFTLASSDRPGDPRFQNVSRQVVENFLVTFPSDIEDALARQTLGAFLAEAEEEKVELAETLERFAFPPLPGLTFLKLVENVDQLQSGQPPAAERTEQIQGVTYYCRYVVLPLSYITARNLKELNSSALDPGVDVDATLRNWERDSYRVMLSTFRHEMVHVWNNSSLGPPIYRDRERYPQWFTEGSATFLAADPHSGLSERYQGYQKLFFYLVERHGVTDLSAFYERILAGASVRESLEQSFGITGSQDLRDRQARWHGRKELVSSVLAIALLVVVLAAFASRRLPIIGSFQLWLAVTLAYSTFSGFCELTQAYNGTPAIVFQQVVLGVCALWFAVKGAGSVRRSFRRTA